MDRLKLDDWCEKAILGIILAILAYSAIATGCVLMYLDFEQYKTQKPADPFTAAPAPQALPPAAPGGAPAPKPE